MLAEACSSRREAPLSFAHLRRLTDDTGLLEHALGRIPRRREGYTADDNARALWTMTEWLALGPDELRDEDVQELNRLADIYLAYLLWTQNENGWWHNNIAYDRSPEQEEISHDCQGRSVWSCADAWVRLDGAKRDTARIIVERAMPTLSRIGSHRGQAFTMAACAHLLEAGERGAIALPDCIRDELSYHLKRLEQLLNNAFRHFTIDQWRWFEPAMTYGNGVLPWAMLRAYRYTRRAETLRTGLESLKCLLEVMTAEEGWLRPIGNEGWCTPKSASRWDQQPLEMFKLALAMEEAAAALAVADRERDALLVGSTAGTAAQGAGIGTGSAGIGRGAGSGIAAGSSQSAGLGHGPGSSSSANSHAPDIRYSVNGGTIGRGGTQSHYREIRDLCRSWYYGENDLHAPLVDPSDGSCCDGLTKYGPNINCGAEATISYLMTEALCRRK